MQFIWSHSSEFEELEAVPTMSVMEGPLEPPSTAFTPTDAPEDHPAFVNFFSVRGLILYQLSIWKMKFISVSNNILDARVNERLWTGLSFYIVSCHIFNFMLFIPERSNF